ncbi:MAG: SH3 domain-containing protein [Oscillospiraceae bacterium]
MTQANNGAAIQVLGQWENWYVVNFNGVVGYASSNFITF